MLIAHRILSSPFCPCRYIKGGAASEAEVRRHESPLDAWWAPVTPAFGNVAAPAVFWAGWYDIFLDGNLAAYNGYQTASRASARGRNWLVVDPLGHCQEAHRAFPGLTEGV